MLGAPEFPKQGLMIVARCDGCAREFWKKLTEFMRNDRHFCSARCYRLNIDYRCLAVNNTNSMSWQRIPAAKRIERSRKGGLRRAETQPKEKLKAIAQLGVAARLALPAEARSRHARKAAAGANLTRWGKFPRRSWIYPISPAFLRRDND